VELPLHAYFSEPSDKERPGFVATITLFRAALSVFGSVVAAVTYEELRRMSGERHPGRL
jgi:hypothetical protein